MKTDWLLRTLRKESPFLSGNGKGNVFYRRTDRYLEADLFCRRIGQLIFEKKHYAICLKNDGKRVCFFIGNQRKILKKCKKTLAIPVFMPYNNSCCDIEC
mgnify:FL=1